jgi:hypothetical protein
MRADPRRIERQRPVLRQPIEADLPAYVVVTNGESSLYRGRP